MSFKKRAPRAIKEIRKFAEKAMVSVDILWKRFHALEMIAIPEAAR